MGRLEQARRQVVAGGFRAVLLCGAPGIGKTRTAAEVAQAAFEEGAIVLYGRCDEDIAAPYQPFAEALDWYTGHVAHPVLGRHPGELRRLQPLLGAQVRELPAPVPSDPRGEESLLFEAIRSWLLELSGRQPVILVLDDLHWAPTPVLLLLRHVVRAAAAKGDGVRLLVLGTYRDTELGHSHTLAAAMADVRRLPGVEQLTLTGLSADQPGMPTPAQATGRPLLSISTQEINLDGIGPDETLPAEIVDVFNLGGGALDWTVTTEADWIDLEPQAGSFRLTMRPRPGVNRANVVVRDRGRGGTRTLRVSVRVRGGPSDRPPASVDRPRPSRRRWVPVAALLLAAMLSVLGAWASRRPRSTEAGDHVPTSTGIPTTTGIPTGAGVADLDELVADFGPLGFTPPEQFEHIDSTSLSTSGFDPTQQRWLREAGLRRVLVVKYRLLKAGRLLELRIFEVRGPAEARQLQRKLSICLLIKPTRTFRAPGVAGSIGTECVPPPQGPTQEITFTRGPRLIKLKLWGHSPPRSRDVILKLARTEAAAVAR
jgi:hypothetical protein